MGTCRCEEVSDDICNTLHGLHSRIYFLDQNEEACIELAEKKYGGSFRCCNRYTKFTGIEVMIRVSLALELPDGVTTVIHRGVNSLIACVGKGHCKMDKWKLKELADYVERKTLPTEKPLTSAKLASVDVDVTALMQW